uniref:Uncharacterized protein n=1 Tax=Lactuca sativa TaxID=4236 RepID=A0A9R1W5C8_LACSA|nr:hypothetical protein LSAT_V11C300105970 [Lactuca sativa]
MAFLLLVCIVGHYNIFIGDLSPEVIDAMLFAWFSVYASCLDTRVMWDKKRAVHKVLVLFPFGTNRFIFKIINSEYLGKWLGYRFHI